VSGRRLADIALVALLLSIAVLAFAQSYQRWLDPIIDTGRDLYIPEQIGHGAKLYRDIRYQYPPLAPYLLAAITSVIGHSLAAYAWIGIAQSVVIAAGLWMIGRRVAGQIGGFVAALFFVALSFTGASTWGANFIFPYSYGATIGMALLIASLAAFLFERPSIALAALLVASWCKVEYAVAAVFIVVVLAAARRISLRQAAGFAAGALTTFAVAAFYFRDTAWLRENVFAAALTKGVTARRFFQNVSGVADWTQNLVTALFAIAGLGAIVWLLRSERRAIVITLVLAISVLLSGHSFFRAWGILQVVALLYALRVRAGTLATIAAFSIATSFRIPLNVSPVWYGFVLIVPLYALIAYVLFAYLPERGVYSARASLWWIPLIALLCGRDLGVQRVRYAVKSALIVSSRGVFYDANPDRARVLNEFINTVHGGTLAVMPEGITLNYLTRTTTPLTFHTFTPVETADSRVEDSILSELRAHPPDRVAIVSRDVREFGYRGFGVDYDRRLFAELLHEYSLERKWFPPRFQLILLRRVGVRSPVYSFYL
jgi:hypothetical protein